MEPNRTDACKGYFLSNSGRYSVQDEAEIQLLKEYNEALRKKAESWAYKAEQLKNEAEFWANEAKTWAHRSQSGSQHPGGSLATPKEEEDGIPPTPTSISADEPFHPENSSDTTPREIKRQSTDPPLQQVAAIPVAETDNSSIVPQRRFVRVQHEVAKAPAEDERESSPEVPLLSTILSPSKHSTIPRLSSRDVDVQGSSDLPVPARDYQHSERLSPNEEVDGVEDDFAVPRNRASQVNNLATEGCRAKVVAVRSSEPAPGNVPSGKSATRGIIRRTKSDGICKKTETNKRSSTDSPSHEAKSSKKTKLPAIYSMAPARKKWKLPEKPAERKPMETAASIALEKQHPMAVADTLLVEDEDYLSIEIPDWYNTVHPPLNTFRSEVITLRRMNDIFKTFLASKAAQNGPEAILRSHIQKMSLFNFQGKEKEVIKRSKLLTDSSLSSITACRMLPPDIRQFTLWLRDRWWKGDTNPDLLRGVKRAGSKTTKDHHHTTYTIDPTFPYRISSNYIGQGALHIGQWWPLMICANRDGAHGEIEAGIHGSKKDGAFSIVISGAGYADIDEGDRIQYCGTVSSHPPQPSASTQLMLTAFRKQQPLRVLRSHNGKNVKLRPKRGLRYDGLYTIKGFEIVEEATALHRFSLDRLPGQESICSEGLAVRPCLAEIQAVDRDRALSQASEMA